MTWDSEAEVYVDPAPLPTNLQRRAAVLQAIADERRRQIKKWGEQSHPDGTSARLYAVIAHNMKALCEARSARGAVSWLDILLEEVYEAAESDDPDALAKELDQVAAVCVAWREDILSRA